MEKLIEALGSFFFVFLFLVRIDQALQGSITAWFLAAQSALTAFLIIFRKPPQRTSPWPIEMIAWLSSIAPLGIIVSRTTTSLFVIPGLIFSIWSLIAIGDSFSIAPSERGLVQRGPFRLLRHPMYAGELYSMIAQCAANHVFWNFLILILFCVTLYMRIIEEESILNGYYRYTRVVRWRLLPGVW